MSFALLALAGAVPPAVVAQNASPKSVEKPGAISGVVVDAKQGEPLPGANVTIKGTTTGTTTDLKGRYQLSGLEPGTYDVLISFVGFQQKTVTGVEVKAGQSTTLEVTLAEQTKQLDEVVIKAEAARNSKAGMLKERAKAAGLTNAISAETIDKSGSSTAAGAVKKVTGASITEGKFVNVRGLGGRYVNAQLNGAELPSASPNKNSVPLDLFPAGLLDNIVTSKTFTPDKPGNFTGGNVNLSTKSFPEDRTLSFSTSVTYHSEVRFNDVLLQEGGMGSLPSFIPSLPKGELTADNQPIPPAGPTLEKQGKKFLDRTTEAFSRGKVTPRQKSGPLNQSYSASFGDQFKIFGDLPLGVVTGVKYSRGTSASRNRLSASAGPTTPTGVKPDYQFTGESGSTEDVLGGIANLSFKPHPNHEFSLNTLYNRTSEKSAAFLTGRQPRDDANRIFRRRRVEPIDRSLWSVQGKGEHLLGSGSGSPRLTWNSSYSRTTQDESDVRFFTDDYLPSQKQYRIAISAYEQPTRYFRDLSEFTWSNDATLSVPFSLGNVKVGGSYLYRKRDLKERRFTYGNLSSVPYRGNPDTYFSECIGIIDKGDCDDGAYQGTPRPNLGVVIQEQTRNQNNLVGDRTVGAGFAMIDTQVPGISNLRFIGGLRVEYTDQFIETREGETGQIQETDLLPSANLVYSLREDMNVRGAYGRTLARPTFREFSPASYYDFKRLELFDGNPNLDRTLVHNFDLRWEWFTGPGELFAVSGYYKSFDAPIEKVIDERAFNRVVTYVNQQSAQVYGAEFEARKRLGFLAKPLRHVEVGGNFTLTESTVTDTSGQNLGRPLVGQSSYLVNANVSYDNPKIGTTVSVYYNYFADRLDTIERENQPDQYERGRHTIDVIASQSLSFGVSLEVSVKNVLNEETEVYQNFPNGQFTTVRYQEGRTISVGFSYDL